MIVFMHQVICSNFRLHNMSMTEIILIDKQMVYFGGISNLFCNLVNKKYCGLIRCDNGSFMSIPIDIQCSPEETENVQIVLSCGEKGNRHDLPLGGIFHLGQKMKIPYLLIYYIILE